MQTLGLLAFFVLCVYVMWLLGDLHEENQRLRRELDGWRGNGDERRRQQELWRRMAERRRSRR